MARKYIVITWFDSFYEGGPYAKGDFRSRCEMESAGHYVSENDDHVSIAMEFDEEYETWRHITHIPKVNIIKRRFIVDAHKKKPNKTKKPRKR